MISNLLTILNFSSIENQVSQIEEEGQYDPFKVPPNIIQAQGHKVASKFALTTEKEIQKNKMCPCCGNSIAVQELGLGTSIYDLNFNGSGVPLYFEFIMFAICYTVLLGSISGVYTAVRNALGDRCEVEQNQQCITNYYNLFSLSNRTGYNMLKYHREQDLIQVILDLVATVLLIMSTVYYRRYMNLSSAILQNAYIAVSDFSIQVNNLPKDATEQEIKEFFSTIIKNDQHKLLDIKKITMGYNINQYYELLNEKAKKRIQLMNHQSMVVDYVEELEQELAQIQEKISNFEDNFETIFKFSGVAFITYNKSSQARAVRNYYSMTKLELMLHKLTSFFSNKDYQKFRDKIIYVQKAPEPGDIQWENLGMNPWKQWRYQQLTNIVTFLLLSLCFALIFLVSFGQEQINNSETNQETSYAVAIAITFLGIGSSFLISIINLLLGFALRKLVDAEKPTTSTDYNTSVAIKLGVSQFFNTAIIPLFVNIALQENGLIQMLWKNGGVNSDISLIIIVNAIFAPIITFIDPYYFYKIYQERKIMEEGNQCQLTQKEANEIFEGPVYDISKKYATLAKTLLVTFFYAKLLPLAIPFALLSFTLIYWVDKLLLLRRNSKGPPIGDGLAEEMVNFYIELTFFAFSVGCCVWQQFVYGNIHIITWCQLGLASICYILPLGMIFEKIINVGEVKIKVTYEASKRQIWDDYPRRNPVTQNKAMDEWIKEITQEEAIADQQEAALNPGGNNRARQDRINRKIQQVFKLKKLHKTNAIKVESKLMADASPRKKRNFRNNVVIPHGAGRGRKPVQFKQPAPPTLVLKKSQQEYKPISIQIVPSE